jgi:hypothetical protein
MRTVVLGVSALFVAAGLAASCGGPEIGQGTGGSGGSAGRVSTDSGQGGAGSRDVANVTPIEGDATDVFDTGGSGGGGGAGGTSGCGAGSPDGGLLEGGGGGGGCSGSGGSSGTSGVDAGAGCFRITNSGELEECSYQDSSSTEFMCAELPDFSKGSCPSLNLYGCCVDTTMKGKLTTVLASCFYSAKTGATPKANCTGTGIVWQTTPP